MNTWRYASTRFRFSVQNQSYRVIAGRVPEKQRKETWPIQGSLGP